MIHFSGSFLARSRSLLRACISGERDVLCGKKDSTMTLHTPDTAWEIIKRDFPFTFFFFFSLLFACSRCIPGAAAFFCSRVDISSHNSLGAMCSLLLWIGKLAWRFHLFVSALLAHLAEICYVLSVRCVSKLHFHPNWLSAPFSSPEIISLVCVRIMKFSPKFTQLRLSILSKQTISASTTTPKICFE